MKRTTWRLVLGFSMVGTAGSADAAPTLVGDTVEVWGVAQLNGSETLRDTVPVVDPGVEYTSTIVNDIFDLDVGPTSISLTTLSPWFSPWFNSGNSPSALELRDLDFVGEPDREIVGVLVDWTGRIFPDDSAPANYPDFSEANVTWTADSVRLETGPYRFAEDSTVTIQLLTAVPEPGAACLLTLGGVVAVVRGRRLPSGADAQRLASGSSQGISLGAPLRCVASHPAVQGEQTTPVVGVKLVPGPLRRLASTARDWLADLPTLKR